MIAIRTRIGRWLREPLLHFVLLGGSIFLLSQVFSDSTAPERGEHITVSRSQLARYALTQRPELNATSVAAFLDTLPAAQLDELIETYVAQEVMVREARALGLDQGDPVVRQRLVSKLQFLLENTDVEPGDPDESTLQQYYEAHRDEYRQPPLLTFSHVFFDNRQGGTATALRRAREALLELNRNQVAFGDGPAWGDPYVYQTTYIQRPQEMISQHFSVSMAQRLWALAVADGLWQGPVASPYGQHLVMISQRQGARLPTLAEVRPQVLDAVRRARARAAADAALQQLLERYVVDVDLPGARRTSPPQPSGNPTSPR